MTQEDIKKFVQEWIDSHEPDTFVRNSYGQIMYSAGYSSLNLTIFFEMLLSDFVEEQNSNKLIHNIE